MNPEIDLSKGIRQMARFTAAPGKTASEAFPYPSVVAAIKATSWPRMRGVGRSPNEIDPGEWTETLNGIVIEGAFWYVVTERKAFKIPLSLPLSEASDLAIDTIAAPGWSHGGGCFAFNGRLYVATEGEKDKPQPGQIWTLDLATLDVIQKMDIDPAGNAPWISIQRERRLIFTSNFDAGTSEQIRVFKLHTGPLDSVEFLGALTLVTELGDPIDLKMIQAGYVTPNNHLLLACDTEPGEAVAGIHLFDLQTGRRRWHLRVDDKDPYVDVIEWVGIKIPNDEFEALLVHPFGKDGILHLGMLNKDAGRDDFSFLNFDAEPVFDQWKL